MENLFHIILPTYNRAHIIERALNSVWNQSFTNWQLWIIDDGSTDQTIELIQKMIRVKKNTHLIHSKHQGAAQARNLALKKISEGYVTFLDSDDEYHPEHLKLHNELLQKNPEIDFVYGKVVCTGNPWVPDVENLQKKIHIEDCIVTGTLFIKNQAIQHAGLFPKLPYAEDFHLVQKLKTLGARYKISPHRTYYYHNTQTESICQQVLKDPIKFTSE